MLLSRVGKMRPNPSIEGMPKKAAPFVHPSCQTLGGESPLHRSKVPMTTFQWILTAAAALLVGFIGVRALQEYFWYKDFREGRFKEDMIAAILHSQPKWPQILAIAEASEIPHAVAYQATRELYKDILTGATKKLQLHRELIEAYIQSHQRAEPFEGLPNEIRIHLERLHDALGDRSHLLDPLTSQIRDLVSVHKQEYKLQKRYTSWGFLIGLVGLLFAAYAYFYPYVSGAALSPPNRINGPS
jgi:hypothetical protein